MKKRQYKDFPPPGKLDLQQFSSSYKFSPPVSFSRDRDCGAGSKIGITYLDQLVVLNQRPRLTLPTLAIAGKFAVPKEAALAEIARLKTLLDHDMRRDNRTFACSG